MDVAPARKFLLAPAALAYAAGAALHRALRTSRAPENNADLPVIAVGSLRAGGAGKTPVALELARILAARGLRVAVLAHRIRGAARDAADEVFSEDDWRASSDEAVMLARALRGTGARVFVTRDRAGARAQLARAGAFDAVVSDDGLMDPRLAGRRVLRALIAAAGERPGPLDLLPAGPYRMTTGALRRADRVLRPGEDFTRAALPPEAATAGDPHWILCGLGNPGAFRRALEHAGIRVAGCSAGPDHGLPDLDQARRDAARAGAVRFLCSAKDWIKLEAHPRRPPNLEPVEERVALSPAFVRAVDDFLAAATS